MKARTEASIRPLKNHLTRIKMKSLSRLMLATACAGVLFACKKSSDNNSTAPMSNSDAATQSDDQTRVSNESDAAFNDVSTVMESQTTVAGSSVNTVRFGTTTTGVDTVKDKLICDAVVTFDTTSATRTLTINYNGGGCGFNRKRTGTVTISIPAGVHWRDKGAQVTVVFNLTITRLTDNKSIVLTGSHVYTNVTGGNIGNLTPSSQPIIHTVTSDNMVITFDNGAQRTWHVARQRTYTNLNGFAVALSGTHTDGATSGISEWGTNRFGNSFTNVINQPLTVQASCGWQLTSGQFTLNNAAGSTSITFGLDANGNATGCPISGATYYFKLAYTNNQSKTYTFILPY
jgi:hypothetical protein